MPSGGGDGGPDFRAIFEAVSLPCIVVDADFDIVAVNDAYCAATLIQRDAVVGRKFLEVFPDNPDDPQASGNSNLRASLERVRRDLVADSMPVQKYDIPVPGETEFEERYWVPTNAPILDSDGALQYILHSARDVTAAIRIEDELAAHRSLAEVAGLTDEAADVQGSIVEQTRQAAAASRELKEANAALQRRTEELARAHARADKASAAKSEFLSRMSHELRTPLNAILGFAQLLAMEDLQPDQQTSVDHIAKAGTHLIALVNEILDLERVEAGRLSMSIELVDLATVVASVTDIAGPLADRKGITLSVVPAEPPAYAHADFRRLTQTVLNLVGNAIKYTQEGGQVTIIVDRRDDEVLLHVADNGPGIRAEDIEKAFEPFERLAADNSQTEGAGLGLPLARRLAEAMGGSIEVDSTPGAGSTFTVVLRPADPPSSDPSDREAAADGRTDGAAAAVDDRASGRVLCVEDNPMNVALITRIARRNPGWRMTYATTVAEAYELISHEPPDLVLLDLHLPDGNGLEVLQTMRGVDATRDIPVIALTADAMPATRTALLEAGADAFVTKPFDVEVLEATVEPLLATGRKPAV